MSECSKCGQCCEYIVFEVPFSIYTQEERKYFELRGIKFERKNRNTDYEIVPCICEKLTSDNLCSIWKERPSVCKKSERRLSIYKFKDCTGE